MFATPMPENPASIDRLECHTFSTKGISSRDRVDAWKEYMRPVGDFRPLENWDGVVDMATWDLGDSALCQERTAGAAILRSARSVRTSAADHWHFLLLKSGTSWTASDNGSDRALHGRAGDIALYSLGVPLRAEISAAETLLLFVPRDAFSIGSEHLDRAINTILQSPLRTFLADYLMALERHLPLVTYRDLPAIDAVTRSTIAACMIADRDSIAEGATGLAVGARERVRRVVRARLGEALLTPVDVARAVGISRSTLYRIFEQQGGVAHYIQKCRLAAAHKALCDPEDFRHIRQIAEGVGFASPQEFSRTFRKAYGYSPSEARNEVSAMHGVALSNGQFDAAEGPRSLAEFLRSTS